MLIEFKCGKCKDFFKVNPFSHSHSITEDLDPDTNEKYFWAHIRAKYVCPKCGDMIYSKIDKRISNKDIEGICYGTEEKHN